MQASHARFPLVDPADKIPLAVCRHVCGLRSRFPFLPAFVSARGVPPEQLGLLLSAGTAVRLLTAPLAGHLGDCAPRAPPRARRLHRACRRGDVELSRGAGLVEFARGEPAACRGASTDYRLSGRIGTRSCFSTAEQRSPRLRVWLGAWLRLSGLHRRHVAGRTSGERLRPRPHRLPAGRAARRGRFGRAPRAGTDSPAHNRCRASAEGRGSHAPPATAVSASSSGGSPHPRQPRHARRFCSDPLECRRHQPGDS